MTAQRLVWTYTAPSIVIDLLGSTSAFAGVLVVRAAWAAARRLLADEALGGW